MSTGTEKITINIPGMSNQEIKSSLISIYDKINKPPTKEVGYDPFLKLVHKNLHAPSQMNFIINHVSEFITPLEPKEKDPCMKLLSLIFYSPSSEEESIDSKIYFPYLSPVLTTLQNLIKDSNSTIFPTISNVFAEIVQNIMPTDIEASNIELEQEEKTAYEMMQGFCIYNMKYDDKSNRIVGSLCLTKLVENCPVVLQKQYMKLIWEVIMNLIDKKNFNAKYELLNCLISLILGAENLFTPYAHNTLYKVLDFLADTDWLKRKLALNVIYTLIFYCKDEILPLKEHIISFLRALKTDKVKEVREVCLLILKIFSENEPKNKENTKDKNKSNFSSINNSKKKFGNKVNSDNKNTIKNNKKINNTSNNNNISTNTNNNTNNNKLKGTSQKKLGNKLNKDNELEKSSNKFSECIVPEIRNKDSKENKISENFKSDFDRSDMAKEEQTNQKKLLLGVFTPLSEQENSGNITKKTGMSSSIKNNLDKNNIKENNENTQNNQTTNQNKFVNRKDDKTFINEKMVIKPDPNKSIFKSSPNPAFFNQANKKSKDIVLVSKGDSQKFKNNSINNSQNQEIVINIKEKNKTDIDKNNNEKQKENELEQNIKQEEKKENVNISINSNKINTNEVNTNIKENKESKENKEKINPPVIKNKVAPIKRTKYIKKIPEKEEKIEKINEPENEENNIIIKFNKKDDEEIKVKNYKTYLKQNEEKQQQNIEKKESNKKNYDPNLINTLLLQMNSLSQKQLSLIDVMDNIQMETQGQIKQLNKRISKLEKNVEELSNELYYLKNEE